MRAISRTGVHYGPTGAPWPPVPESHSTVNEKRPSFFPRLHCRRLGVGLAALPLLLALAGAVLLLPQLTPSSHADSTGNPSDYPAREKGRRAMGDSLYEAAERFFTEYRDAARGREPACTDAVYRLVQALMMQKKVDAAAAALAEYDAGGKHTQDANYREKLEIWRGIVLMDQNKLEDARRIFQAVADSSSNEGRRDQALEQLGDALARMGRWPEAEAVFRRILQHLQPGKEPELRRRANIGVLKSLLGGGDPARGEAYMAGLAKENAPETLKPYRCLLMLARQQTDDAWKLFQECRKEPAAATGTDFWLIAGKMAEALSAAKRFAEARDALEASLSAAPSATESRQTRLRMVECITAQGKTEAAIASLEQFMTDFPGAPELVPAGMSLADLLRQAKRFLPAAERYRAVADNKAATADLRQRAAYSRALCLRDAGRLEDAAAAFALASWLGQTPQQQSDSLLLAAETAFAAGRFTDAATWYGKAADSFPFLPTAEKARFNQAVAMERDGRAAAAAAVLRDFIAAHPAGEFQQPARLELGRALKDAADFPGAIRELNAFVKDTPASPLAPQALLEAHSAAVGNDDMPQAVAFLSRLLDEYPESTLAADALYERTRLRFMQGESQAAEKDAAAFLEKYTPSRSPKGADILMWLGDYFQNTGRAAKAEESYMGVAAQYPASPIAPDALLAAAKSAFRRGNPERAAKLADPLFRDYAQSMSPDVRAQACLMRGDILAGQGRHDEAFAQFTAAAAADPGTAAAFAAEGRRAEMLYNLADGKPENLEKAAGLFRTLAGNEKAPKAEREKARYRLAKTCEKQAQAGGEKAKSLQKEAVKEYLEIVYDYDLDVRAGKTRDWFYFARAGLDAAQLLVLSEEYEQAARLYERVGAAGIPESIEARAKAAEIRKVHRLDE